MDRVIVALPNIERDGVVHLIRDLRELNVQIDVVPFFHEVLSPAMDIHSIEGLPLLGLRPADLSRSSRLFKRAMDLTLSALGLLLLAPLFLAIALTIRLDSKGPVFFRQVRMGRGNRQDLPHLQVSHHAADADASERGASATSTSHATPGR